MKTWRLSAIICAAALATVFQAGAARAELKKQWIDYKDGEQALQGLLVFDDARSGKRPGVLLVHRRDGMSDFTIRDAEWAARLGYVVFAPDIYGKEFRPTEVKDMIALSGKFQNNRPLMRSRIQAGFDMLRNNPMVDTARIAMVGYCFGGNVALEFAEQGPPLVGTVVVHGSFRNLAKGAAANIKGRVLILHGADDPEAPLAGVLPFTKELSENKIAWEMRLYSNTGHAYTSETNTPDDERAKVESFEATEKFFRQVFAE